MRPWDGGLARGVRKGRSLCSRRCAVAPFGSGGCPWMEASLAACVKAARFARAAARWRLRRQPLLTPRARPGRGHATDPKARHSIREVIAAAVAGGGGAGREARGPASAVGVVGVVGGVEPGRGVRGVGWGEAAGVPDRAWGGDGAGNGFGGGGGAWVLRARCGTAADAGAHHRRAAQAGAAAAVKERAGAASSP